MWMQVMGSHFHQVLEEKNLNRKVLRIKLKHQIEFNPQRSLMELGMEGEVAHLQQQDIWLPQNHEICSTKQLVAPTEASEGS